MSNYMAEVMAPTESQYKAQVYAATWGHLAAKKGRAYKGRIVYAVGCYGDDSLNPTALATDFPGLHNSPWEYDAVYEFLHHKDTPKDYGCVYEFVGTMRNYECKGIVRKILDAYQMHPSKNTCKKCETPLTRRGRCRDITCPYSQLPTAKAEGLHLTQAAIG